MGYSNDSHGLWFVFYSDIVTVESPFEHSSSRLTVTKLDCNVEIEIIIKVVTEKIFNVEKTEARFAKLGLTTNRNYQNDSNEVYTQSLQEAEFGTKVETRVTVTAYPSRIQAALKENEDKQVAKTTPRKRGETKIDQIYVLYVSSSVGSI